MIKRLLHALFAKPQKPTGFEIRITANANFIVRTLTSEASAWAEKFLGDPLPNGDRVVSGAIVTAIATVAIKRGYHVRFV